MSTNAFESKGKGQAAIEYLVFFGLFLLLFTVILGYFTSQQATEYRMRQIQLAREVASQYADEINYAVAIGDGYERNATFTKRIAGSTPYIINVTKDGFVELKWVGDQNYSHVFPLMTSNITAKTSAGGISIDTSGNYILNTSRGYLVIRNDKGEIILEQ